MPLGVLSFKRTDLQRAVRATQTLGLKVDRITLARDGTVQIDIAEQGPLPALQQRHLKAAPSQVVYEAPAS